MYYLKLCCTKLCNQYINKMKSKKIIMRTLAIDVGTGTQDIMIYDDEKELENSIKLVLPSPHLYISQQVREIENDIYFKGEIIKYFGRIVETQIAVYITHKIVAFGVLDAF